MDFKLYTQLRSLEFRHRQQRLLYGKKQLLTNTGQKSSSPLHVVYVIHHGEICGGLKVILEHANGLQQLGMEVTIVSHASKPDWFAVEANYIEVPYHLEIAKGIPHCDVIVAAYWDQIQACIDTGIAPVIYFEQGDFHLFEPEKMGSNMTYMVKKLFTLPEHIMTVSKPAANKISEHYKRNDVRVFPNAIDHNQFYPAKAKPSNKSMIIVGDEQVTFKGIKDLKEIHSILIQKGFDLDLIWISPRKPVEDVPENIRLYIAPDQKTIGHLYREASLFVCGSYYEAFGLPGLEAMACGTPVVTSKAEGVYEYAIDNYNCLLADAGDINGFVEKIELLLKSEELYKNLQKNGLKTAEKYNWKHILTELKTYYYEVSMQRPKKINSIGDWELSFTPKELKNKSDWNSIEAFLKTTNADEIQFLTPASIVPGYDTVVWSTLARRNKSRSSGNREKLNIIVNKKELDWNFNTTATLYEKGDYEEGIKELKERSLSLLNGTLEHGVCLRWIILFLLELNMINEAYEIAASASEIHPMYTDIRYLYAYCCHLMNETEVAKAEAETCIWMKEAYFYPEFFHNVTVLAKVLLDEINS
ncbi:hypothetical protein BTR23_13765 [Alkalihalophilus pseudofirmus]|nr:hypothetical protein BTR23_13765 [Alkalihalophilus pseudofirmus]